MDRASGASAGLEMSDLVMRLENLRIGGVEEGP